MVSRYELSHEQWDKIADLLPGRAGTAGARALDNRNFVNGVLWILRSGARWCDLPERYGKWNTLYRRFWRWEKTGVWDKVFRFLTRDRDNEYLMIDSTIIRAHQQAATGRKKRGPHKALGRSRGGLTTKIHMLCDALGNPVDFIITGGQVADCTQAIPLLEKHRADYVLADKGYDSNAIIEHIESSGATAVIPPKSNRKTPRPYDKTIYKERNLIERLFSKLKHFRKLATRFEKNLCNYKAVITIACIFLWLK